MNTSNTNTTAYIITPLMPMKEALAGARHRAASLNNLIHFHGDEMTADELAETQGELREARAAAAAAEAIYNAACRRPVLVAA